MAEHNRCISYQHFTMLNETIFSVGVICNNCAKYFHQKFQERLHTFHQQVRTNAGTSNWSDAGYFFHIHLCDFVGRKGIPADQVKIGKIRHLSPATNSFPIFICANKPVYNEVFQAHAFFTLLCVLFS